MILDNNLIVAGTIAGSATAQVLTGQTVTGASAVISTDKIDLSQNRDIMQGNDFLKLRFQVPVAFTGLTALTVEIVQADDALLTTNVTAIGSSGPIPVAQLVVGYRGVVEGNARIGSVGQRYLGARFTPTGTGTAGSIFAEFGDQVQDGRKFYPVGYSVL